jgi:ectoine hydroxylase-related dioxygenase (phytanoyl-CoA dioxygenase family)
MQTGGFAGSLNMPWFESPLLEEDIQASGLAPEDKALVQRFRDDGYLIIEEPIVDDALADAVRKSLRGKYTGAATGYDEAGRLQDAWKFNAHVKDIATRPRVLQLLELLYRRRPIPFQTLNFEVGTQQMAHSDTIHFHSIPQKFMCGVWVALEDTDHANGPLFYHEGSHRLPVYDFFDLGIPAGYEHYQEYERRVEKILERAGSARREFHLKKGQAVIWSANLFHGGAPIRDARRTRLSQVTHYCFDDCIYYQPAESNPYAGYMQLKKVVDIGTGLRVPHRYLGRGLGPYEYFVSAQYRLKKVKKALRGLGSAARKLMTPGKVYELNR